MLLKSRILCRYVFVTYDEPSEAEVAHFNIEVGIYEHIMAFDISVYDS